MRDGRRVFRPAGRRQVMAFCVAILIGAGGCSDQSAGRRNGSALGRSDLSRILRTDTRVRVGKTPVAVRFEKIVDEKEALLGYVQERWYKVLEGEEVSETRLVIVYDGRWYRQGFVTETGAAYKHNAKGEAVRLPAAGFVENVKSMLGIEVPISFAAYDPEKDDESSDGGKKGDDTVPAPAE